MSMSDPIADMLTKIRNAVHAKHPRVDIAGSKIKISILDILKEEGFIRGYKIFENNAKKTLRIYLKYTGNEESVIQGLKRMSKPGRRLYQKSGEIKPILNNIGISVISTSQGIMSGKEAAQKKIGGELIALIW